MLDNSLPIPYQISLNQMFDPLLYRAHASNVGPPIKSQVGIVDSEGKGRSILFNLSGSDVIEKCNNGSQIIQQHSFVLKNIGTLPLSIFASMVGVSTQGCENGGFKVRGCGKRKNPCILFHPPRLFLVLVAKWSLSENP